MAEEGLVLASRAKARLGQSLSAAQPTEGHLQVVGVGEWDPTSTRPAWNAEAAALLPAPLWSSYLQSRSIVCLKSFQKLRNF